MGNLALSDQWRAWRLKASAPTDTARVRLDEMALKDRQRAEATAREERAGCPTLHRVFEKRVGYPLDLQSPRSFNQKIQWRKLKDRNPLYPVIVDKYRVRDWVRRRLGRRSKALFAPLHGRVHNPFDMHLEGLPAHVALKASHGSGWNMFRQGDGFLFKGKVLKADAARLRCARWLLSGFGRHMHEWAYWSVPRCILVEEMFLGSDGARPDDLKCVMFGGRLAYSVIERDRFGQYWQASYDADWNRLPFVNKDLQRPDTWPMPREYGAMLDLAEELSQGFDHVRVDFLFNDRGFLLNELTIYRGSGLRSFAPAEYDFELGAKWDLGSGSL